MTSFRVTPTELDQSATKIDQLATGPNDAAEMLFKILDELGTLAEGTGR